MTDRTDLLAEPQVRAALDALTAAGVRYCLRNRPKRGDDVDVVVAGSDAARASRVLVADGWRRLAAPGHRDHRFFLQPASGQWLKIDLMTGLRYGSRRWPADGLLRRRRSVGGFWFAGPTDEARHRELRAAGYRESPSIGERIARRLPVGLRRRGCVVAIVGPDGAGKGTVLNGLLDVVPVAVTRVYLGDRRSAKSTRRAPSSVTHPATPPAWRELIWLAGKAARLWLQLSRAYACAWRGHIVLCDRHPVDVVAVRPRRTRLGGATERLLLDRLVPRPDALVVLDAPADVLYARKAEHDVAVLDRWRAGYLALQERDAVVVNTQGTVADAVQSCLDVLWAAFARRRSWPEEL